MEFNEKLQELRKQKGLTQEELAQNLYVSRTAISKWELGRGYPNIESLKAIAKFFSITVDELLSTDEILTIAEADGKQREKRFTDLFFGLLDLSAILLFLLPLFATESNGIIQGRSLIALDGIRLYLKIAYLSITSGIILTGILTLAMQCVKANAWLKIKCPLSISLSVIAVLIFTISSQPYAAIFAFALLIIKALSLIKRK